MERPALCEHFEDLPDPRVRGRCDHELLDVIVISILGVLCGADGWEDIHEFALVREGWLRTFLPLPSGIPGVDTYRRVFAALDPEAFQRCFLSWVRSVMQSTEGKLIAVDGKTVRRSFAREDNKSALHLVSAWCAENRLVLGQVATREKSNEISAIPELLALLDLRGATVTLDAMGCQTDIAKKIIDGGADYVLGLKGNQATSFEGVREFFAAAEQGTLTENPLDFHETIDGDHGRIEVRRVTASDAIDWLDSQRWAGLKSIVKVDSERTVNGKTSKEQRYYLSSLPPDASLLGERIRAHWSIENSLHWVLDMAFDEDRCRIRRRNAPDNFALLRKIAVNLLKLEKTSKRGIEGKRKRAGWDPNYLLTVLGTAAASPD